jgi:hypothetical protein
MPKRRLELTLSDEQWARLERATGTLVKKATYAKQALDEKLALEETLSEAKGTVQPKQAGPVPVDPAAVGSVRPAASPPTSVRKPALADTWAR